VNTNKEYISKSSLHRKLIYSITPFTLLDYPDKTACILWFAGCNMRCSYCYNPEIVNGKGKYILEDVRKFLISRQHFLDAVVLSGGECLLSDGIKDIIAEIKSLGYLVKIDTNGSKPEILRDLINNQLIDYVALDFKATKAKTFHITKADFYAEFMASLAILLQSNIQYEIRTTIHSALLDQNDIQEMVNVLTELGYSGKYFIQHFRNNTTTLGNLVESTNSFVYIDNITDKIEIIIRN
jgi:pyruvate formate lyase activating enzyme